MLDTSEVSGRVGDVSGRVGDVSGRVGDVSGRVGDVSGRLGVSGKIGDVSGRSMAEVEDILLQNRQAETIRCLEIRVDRLEGELVGITRWLEGRLRSLENEVPTNLEGRLRIAESGTGQTESRLRAVEEKLRVLQAAKPPTP